MYCVSSLDSFSNHHHLHFYMGLILLLTLCFTAPPKMIGQTVVYTHAVIIWEKVESTDEENPVTNYTIDSSSSSEPITLPPDSEYYNVTGLSPGREYSVKVAAKNVIGVGRNTTFNITTEGESERTVCTCNDCRYIMQFNED